MKWCSLRQKMNAEGGNVAVQARGGSQHRKGLAQEIAPGSARCISSGVAPSKRVITMTHLTENGYVLPQFAVLLGLTAAMEQDQRHLRLVLGMPS